MSPSEFKTRYPEFVGEADPRIQLFIDESIPHLDQDRWGDLYTQGLGLYVAHSLAWENAIAGTGSSSVDDDTSVSVGDVTISKSADVAKSQMDNDLLRTPYGQRFNRLRKMVGAGAVAL